MNSALVSGKKEILLLATLALVQFVAVVDFMIMPPLAPKLIKLWSISTREFGIAVGAYIFTAGICGFLGAFFIDKFDRKKLLTLLFAGVTIATLVCGLAPNYQVLLLGRIIAGMFGGLLGTMVFSIIGDAIPLERRARSFGLVTASFSLASILGVPGGLYFANLWDWHAPFLVLVGLGVIVQGFIMLFVPSLTGHLNAPKRAPMEVIQSILADKNQMFAIALVITLALGQFSILPLLTAFLVSNVGVSEAQVPLMYLIGGSATVVASPLIGILADKIDKGKIYIVAAILSLIPILALTNFPPATPLVLVFATTTFLFICINGRMIPGMALVQGTVLPQQRGSFTSISSSVQQLSGAMGTFLSGFVVVKGADGLLQHYNWVGAVAAFVTLISLYVVRQIKQIQVPQGFTTHNAT
ncbi:MAG: MFS transporter [Candidatus Kapabacteria bacterium]|jgi:predicted MFS family arabinose efflux permease|nr:MFS transporter [Candidatus Kapabacteria bacterium]